MHAAGGTVWRLRRMPDRVAAAKWTRGLGRSTAQLALGGGVAFGLLAVAWWHRAFATRVLQIEVANWKIVGALSGGSILLLGGLCLRRRPPRWALAGVSMVLALLAAADAVNSYFGYLPQVADVVGVSDWPVVPGSALVPPVVGRDEQLSRTAARVGGVADISVVGAYSGVGRHHVYVYLPPQYFAHPTQRFPVVYLLHGSPGRPQDWLRAARAVHAGEQVAALGRPTILVMPPMSHGWLDDSECVDGKPGQWDTWLTTDVVHAIDRQLRTLPARGQRALAGMSAGGFCALNLLVRHSDEFAAALDMSGYTAPTHAGGVRALFGPRWRTDANMNTPARYIAGHPLVLPLQLQFVDGAADPLPLKQFRALQPVLEAHGVTVRVLRRDGGHTYHVWSSALRDGLRWLSEQMYLGASFSR